MPKVPRSPALYPGLSEVRGPMVHYGSDQGPLCAAVTVLSASLPHQPSPQTHFIHRNIFCGWTLKDFNLWLIPSQHRAGQHCYKAEPLLCVPKLDISDGHIEKDMVFLMHDSSWMPPKYLWLLATNNKGWFDYSALTPLARTSQVLNMRTWQILKSNGQYSLQISTKPPLLSLTTGCHTTHFQKYMFGPRIWSPGRNTNRCYFKSF